MALKGILALEYADFLSAGGTEWQGRKTRKGVKRAFYALFHDGWTQEGSWYIPTKLGPPAEAAFKALMEQVKDQPMPNIHLRGHDPIWWSVLGREEDVNH